MPGELPGAVPVAGAKPAVTIAATATAVPPHILSREEVKFYIRQVFSLEGRHLEALMTVIDNAQVDRRYCILPVEYIIQPRPLPKISCDSQRRRPATRPPSRRRAHSSVSLRGGNEAHGHRYDHPRVLHRRDHSLAR